MMRIRYQTEIQVSALSMTNVRAQSSNGVKAMSDCVLN